MLNKIINTPFEHHLIRLIGLICIIISLTSCQTIYEHGITAVNSEYDLSNYDFEKQGIVELEGDWNYYWNTKVTNVGDLENQNIEQLGKVHLPGFWALQNSEFLKEHPYGLLTLHSTIVLPDTIHQYMFQLKSVVAAYEVWGNGILLSKNGEVGMSKAEMKPDFQPQLITLPRSNKVELFLVISNFHHRKGGGSWEPILLGTAPQIASTWKNAYSYELFTAAILLFISLYHLLMYAFFSKENSYLYFGLFVLAGLIRTVCVGEMVIEEIFPNFPYLINQQLRYIGFYMTVGFISLYTYYLFNTSNKRIIWGCFALAVAFSMATIALPVHLSTYLSTPFHFVAIGIGTYLIYNVIKAIPSNRIDAIVILVAGFILFTAIVHGTFITLNIINGDYYHEAAYLIFVLAQVAILANRHRIIQTKAISLTQSLEHKENDLSLVISDNRMRYHLREELLEKLESIGKEDALQAKRLLNSFIIQLKLKLSTEQKLNHQQENINQINSELEFKIKKIYPELSQSEIELLLLLQLNLSNKEIAQLRNSTEGAVKVARHRIKKKTDTVDIYNLLNVA